MEREKVRVERSKRGGISSSSPFCAYARAREKKRKDASLMEIVSITREMLGRRWRKEG